jgi:retron-type reverse transcriptase
MKAWVCRINPCFMKKQGFINLKNITMYEQICDIENLIKSYKLAQIDNRYKRKICAFTFSLEENLLRIQWELQQENYTPQPYSYFTLHEPKTRNIAAPDFRDRVVQHSLVKIVEPIFEKKFISDSYACRTGRGTHFARKRIKHFLMAARSYYGKDVPIYVLQCDVRKFFQSISWDILLKIIKKYIDCPQTLSLIEKIIVTHPSAKIEKFIKPVAQLSIFETSKSLLNTSVSIGHRTGLPIGNLTSQLFANVYLNELDHYMKDKLRVRWYGRYMDDFLVIHPDREYLKQLRSEIGTFLNQELQLTLHPKKLTIKNVSDGVPFVGYRIFYDHILVRGSTLLHIERNYRSKVKQYKNHWITDEKLKETKASIIGHLKHANSYGLRKRLFKKNTNFPPQMIT